MRAALAVAQGALASGDVPVGAVIVNKQGEIVSTGHNERELHNDPTAHAEIVAIRRACEKSGQWRLEDHTIIVTLEPCSMCAGAIAQSRISTVILEHGMRKQSPLARFGIFCVIRAHSTKLKSRQVF